ncbi:MAG TPA: hypothetical protein VJG90_05150 [Candidatus Nanoarchaeia archaeon]|nr:hypothetical protein [Candidatus Nanoarchaeia archaeon]
MSKLKLRQLLREGTSIPPTLFFHGQDAIWHNARILVVNDPYLLDTLGSDPVQRLRRLEKT